jgi:membrane-bound serine protease (ClpP class)
MQTRGPFLSWFSESLLRLIAVWIVFAGLGGAARVLAADAPVLEVVGAIGPATADYIDRSLEAAERQGAPVVVLRIDTPGGLDSAMRSIVKRIIGASVPVVAYVAPAGARAASAGTYILYASHVAAMAPGTNLGAATPVQLGGKPDLGAPRDAQGDGENGASGGDAKTRKLVNDAAAYLRSLGQLRGRNTEWAEQAVRTGSSLSAREALKQGVIDIVAADLADLRQQLEGRVVQVKGGEMTLHSGELSWVRVEPDWRSRLLSIISDPNLAYILMLVGIYGLVYEFANPGALLPGIAGAICLVLALFAFQMLPINYAGVALILLGLALMVAEVFVPSFGALGIGGIIAFIIGSIILVDTDQPGYGIDLSVILGFTVVSAVGLMAVVGLALKARQRPVVSGREELLGAAGLVVDGFEQTGSIRVHGEIWKARTESPLVKGQQVRVTGRTGLVLLVEPLDKMEE